MSQAFPIKTQEATAFKAQKRAIGYFEEMVWQYHQGNDPCLFLPSLMSLSKSLGCSLLEIQGALIGLRKHGYDYLTMDIYSPITLWYPARISLVPEVETTLGANIY